MTPTRRRECLSIVGWSQRQYAAFLGFDESTVRRWMRDGGEAPPKIDAWLESLAVWLTVNPPPVLAPDDPWPRGRPRKSDGGTK